MSTSTTTPARGADNRLTGVPAPPVAAATSAAGWIAFRKLHGAGNDFLLITDPEVETREHWRGQALRLCARRTGVGADGLVLSAPIDRDPAVREVVCVNADGSIATMCGNALRCAAWAAARDHGLTRMRLRMAGVEHVAAVMGDEVWVTVEVGEVRPLRVNAELDGVVLWFDAAHTGTEHVVAVVDDVDRVDVDGFGRLVRHHPDLAPIGANVDFVQILGPGELRVRTWERGVEAETLSCGSGAVAAVVVARLHRRVLAGTITVHNRCDTPLVVRPHHRSYWLGGPVQQSYLGTLEGVAA